MPQTPLLQATPNGLFVPDAGVYIDPARAVERAIITHGHADHARRGSNGYLAHRLSEPVLRLRLGKNIQVDAVEYGETRTINNISISLHPSGHVPGSAQVRIERNGEVAVIAGDYKTEDDGLIPPFEPVRCNLFVTESTFALPIYRWRPQAQVMAEIHRWWMENQAAGKASVIAVYSLGKAQRILKNLDLEIGPVFVHDTVADINEGLIHAGLSLPTIPRVRANLPVDELRRSLILAPQNWITTSWLRKRVPFAVAAASGWMAVRSMRGRRAAETGFVLSDHADFEGLNWAIKESGADCILVAHGYTQQFARWLTEQGYRARVLGDRYAPIDFSTDDPGADEEEIPF